MSRYAASTGQPEKDLNDDPQSYQVSIFTSPGISKQYPLNPSFLPKKPHQPPLRAIWSRTISPEISSIHPHLKGPEVVIADKQRKPNLPANRRLILKILAVLGAIVLIGVLAIVIVYGIIPCSLTKCHPRASICINSPFYPRCICDYGYQGNGKQYCDECGLTFTKPNLRIIGGTLAEEYSWPYSVIVIINYATLKQLNGVRLKVQISFLCGGTLINRKTVLTASHCNVDIFDYEHDGETFKVPVEANEFYPTRASMMTVYVGVHNRTSMKTWPAKSYSVSNVISHYGYDDTNILNDLAILKLNDAVELNQHVQIACLPDPKADRNTYPISDPSRSAWVVGWGTTEQFGKSSKSLKNARVTIYGSDSCKEVLPENKKNWNSQICAGDIQGYVDTCQGDSGGSLYVNDLVLNKTKYVTAGVVSYGEGCAKVNHPGIYTRTSYYQDWIFEHSDF